MNCDSLVSIIIPVYGTEDYLPNCIDSLRKQTYENIEIILVDDESPDSCPQICDAYSQKDSRIVVVHQKNKGVSGARNVGMYRAKGDFVMFVDSDDELMPDAVSTLLNDAENYKADIVSAKFMMIKDADKYELQVDDHGVTVYTDDVPLLLSLRGDSCTESACAKLFRKSFVQDICFVEGKNINEDGYFIFQCFLKHPIYAQHDTIVYLYNVRAGSNSRQKFSDKYLAMIYFCELKKKIIAEKYPQYHDELKNMEVRVRLQLLDLLCRTTDRQYKKLQKECIDLVKNCYRYHNPINDHYRLLERIVVRGFFPYYKLAVRVKNCKL